MSEQFHNPIEKFQKEEKSILPNAQIHDPHFTGFVQTFQAIGGVKVHLWAQTHLIYLKQINKFHIYWDKERQLII